MLISNFGYILGALHRNSYLAAGTKGLCAYMQGLLISWFHCILPSCNRPSNKIQQVCMRGCDRPWLQSQSILEIEINSAFALLLHLLPGHLAEYCLEKIHHQSPVCTSLIWLRWNFRAFERFGLIFVLHWTYFAVFYILFHLTTKLKTCTKIIGVTIFRVSGQVHLYLMAGVYVS